MEPPYIILPHQPSSARAPAMVLDPVWAVALKGGLAVQLAYEEP